MGIGYLSFETAAYGIKPGQRGGMSNEVMEIVRRLWQGETLNYQGEFFDLKGARCTLLPIQQGGIPMFIGAVAPAGLRRAALLGDGFIGPVELWPAYLDAVKAAGKSEAEARSFWGFYIDTLGGLPREAVTRGVADYVASAAEFFPKPGPLKALCERHAIPIRMAENRARKALEVI